MQPWAWDPFEIHLPYARIARICMFIPNFKIFLVSEISAVIQVAGINISID